MVFEQGKTGIGSTEKLFDMFFTHIGTHRDLGLTLQNIEGDIARIHLPFQSKHADSIENGSLHTTAIATAIDSACGCAVMLHLGKPAAIATVNLRIDYMRKPEPGRGLVIEASCYQYAEDFIYVGAAAYQVNSKIMCCNAVGIFKSDTPGPVLGMEIT
ncbi:PaaI family thioesterase [Litorivivens sp.]|uniref:PaaI family thioesterase n=1 Tax=Litorivivens sp. TaxID=2020868 RepID=UPI0035652D1F